MTQTASSKEHFFSKSTEDEKHSEGELRKIRKKLMKHEKSAHWLYARAMKINYTKLMELLMIAGEEKAKKN